MMNEKKKYIDIDTVVGNLDEVTVKDLRKQAGMSRKDFCNSFEIPYRTLQSWELGEREMSDFSKRLLAYVIKTSELVENYKRNLEKQVEGEQDGEKKEKYRIRFGRGWNHIHDLVSSVIWEKTFTSPVLTFKLSNFEEAYNNLKNLDEVWNGAI